MLTFVIDEPVDHILFAFGPSTAASSQSLTRWAVDGQREKVWGLREISDETPVKDEVEQNKDVHKEDQEKDDHPGFGWVVDSTRRILLCHNGCLEVLLLRFWQLRLIIFLQRLAVARDQIRNSRRSTTNPIVNERRIDGGLQQCAARQDRDGFGHAG